MLERYIMSMSGIVVIINLPAVKDLLGNCFVDLVYIDYFYIPDRAFQVTVKNVEIRWF